MWRNSDYHTCRRYFSLGLIKLGPEVAGKSHPTLILDFSNVVGLGKFFLEKNIRKEGDKIVVFIRKPTYIGSLRARNHYISYSSVQTLYIINFEPMYF
jgi:hypothetical protein